MIFNPEGTLLRGIADDTWDMLYEIAGLPCDEYRANLNKFLAHEISYSKHIENCLEALKNAKLTKSAIETAVKSRCTLAEDLNEALCKLLATGYTLGVISGGVDTVLYAILPRPEKYFGNNIYTNKLIFDPVTEELIDVDVTPYDWDENCKGVAGKEQGLKKMCHQNGIPLKNSCFVGYSVADFSAMNVAGSCILDMPSLQNAKIKPTNSPATRCSWSNNLMDPINTIIAMG